MRKLIVETTGSFMLHDPIGGNEVPAERPAVVSPSALVDTWLARGRLRVIASNLSPKATDAEFAASYAKAKDGKSREKAVDDFVARYTPKSTGEAAGDEGEGKVKAGPGAEGEDKGEKK